MPEVPEELRHKYHYKRNPYPTDELIDSLDDEQLLEHMGVPTKYWEHAIRQSKKMMDNVFIENWIRMWPYIFRPQPEKRRENSNLFGMGLILCGPSGTGKTTTAAALLLRLIRMKIPNADPSGKSNWYGACMGGFVGWQDFSRIARDQVDKDDAEDEYTRLIWMMKPEGSVFHRADFLVVDDISRERVTEFNVGELTWLLRHRNEWGYPTIITTNTPSSEWRTRYGEVMGSFMERSLVQVEFFEDITQ